MRDKASTQPRYLLVSVEGIGVSSRGGLGRLWLGRRRLSGTKVEYLKSVEQALKRTH